MINAKSLIEFEGSATPSSKVTQRFWKVYAPSCPEVAQDYKNKVT
jgi:hypothetical protein